MSPPLRRFATLLPALALTGCATLSQIRALEHVDFSIDRLAEVRLAGVDLMGIESFADLSFSQGAALASAVADRDLPLLLQIQILAENPADNVTDARLVQMDWTLLLEDRETVSGRLDREILLPRGQGTTFPLGVELNLVEFFEGNARELVNLAASLSGYGSETTRIELRALPTIQTPLGPIAYTEPIRIVRTTVGR